MNNKTEYNMKTRLWLLAMLLTFTFAATAQNGNGNGKRNPEQRIEKHLKRMQNSLMLDDAAAAKFAPIYKEYLLEKANCRPDIVRGKNLSDEQIKKNIEARMDNRQKALDIDRKYYGKLSKILNAKQLNVIFGKKAYDKRRMAPIKGECKMKPRNGKPGAQNGKCRKVADCLKAKECKK